MCKIHGAMAIALLISPLLIQPMRIDSHWFQLSLAITSRQLDEVHGHIAKEEKAIQDYEKTLTIEEELVESYKEQVQTLNNRYFKKKKKKNAVTRHFLQQRLGWQKFIEERMPRIQALRDCIKSHNANLAHYNEREKQLQEYRLEIFKYAPIGCGIYI